MHDHILIYLIVALNTICQLMLIWRQKLAAGMKWKFCFLATAVPLAIMISMRLLIAGGMINGRITEQSLVEQCITQATSILLIAGPWLVTLAAIIIRKRQRTMVNMSVTG